MSIFWQYEMAQATHDLASGPGPAAAAFGWGAGLGFGLGLPWWIHPTRLAAGRLPAAGTPPQVRFCGHCGGPLLPGARFCGHCGTATWRPPPPGRRVGPGDPAPGRRP